MYVYLFDLYLGTILQNQCILYVYSIFLLLIIVFQVIVVIIIFIFRNNVLKTYDTGFKQIFHNAYDQNQTNVLIIIENLEYQFQCCGYDNFFDYSKFHYPMPDSCYPNQSPIFHPYYQGCANVVINWIGNELPIIAGVLGGIVLVEIIGIILSLVLNVKISDSPKKEYIEIF